MKYLTVKEFDSLPKDAIIKLHKTDFWNDFGEMDKYDGMEISLQEVELSRSDLFFKIRGESSWTFEKNKVTIVTKNENYNEMCFNIAKKI